MLLTYLRACLGRLKSRSLGELSFRANSFASKARSGPKWSLPLKCSARPPTQRVSPVADCVLRLRSVGLLLVNERSPPCNATCHDPEVHLLNNIHLHPPGYLDLGVEDLRPKNLVIARKMAWSLGLGCWRCSDMPHTIRSPTNTRTMTWSGLWVHTRWGLVYNKPSPRLPKPGQSEPTSSVGLSLVRRLVA